MPGQIYTFERSGDASGPPLPDAVNAIVIAAAEQPAIRYEVLTTDDHPTPMVVVVCPNQLCLDRFAQTLHAIVDRWGVRIRHVVNARGDEASS